VIAAILVAVIAWLPEFEPLERLATICRWLSLLGAYIVVFGFRVGKAALEEGSAAARILGGLREFLLGENGTAGT
jgi:hypothetical protein